jgi:antitoxin YefM
MNTMISEEDWNAIQETLYLLSIPGMRESIQEGLATPVDECEKEPGW